MRPGSGVAAKRWSGRRWSGRRGELAKLVKLMITYNVEWIRYGEAVSNVFILDMKFLNMEHVNAKYSMNHAVGKGRIFSPEVGGKSPRFTAIDDCIDWDGQEHLSLGV
jgi:hypothetical protein